MSKKALFMRDVPATQRSRPQKRIKAKVRKRSYVFKALFQGLEWLSVLLRIAHTIWEFLKK